MTLATVAYYTVPPDGPPLNFEITVQGPRTLTFSWDPPSENLRNGVITGYLLSCDPQPEGLPMTYEQSDFNEMGGVVTTVSGLAPSTTYNCTVLASNIAGNAPTARAIATTGEDCMHIIYSFIITHDDRCTLVVLLPPQRHCSSCNYLISLSAENGW